MESAINGVRELQGNESLEISHKARGIIKATAEQFNLSFKTVEMQLLRRNQESSTNVIFSILTSF